LNMQKLYNIQGLYDAINEVERLPKFYPPQFRKKQEVVIDTNVLISGI
jgi:hypothetical protein